MYKVWGLSLKIHVGTSYIPKTQGGSHVPTLGPRYILYTCMAPFRISYAADFGNLNSITREKKEDKQALFLIALRVPKSDYKRHFTVIGSRTVF